MQALHPIPVVYAANQQERFQELRREEIKAKELHADDLSRRSEILQQQLELERKEARDVQERLFKEFSASLEMERRNLKERMDTIDERQRVFENELARKRDQDELRIRERDEELKRLMLDADRIRLEVLEDRKKLEEQIEGMKKAKADSASGGARIVMSGEERSGETTGQDAAEGEDAGSLDAPLPDEAIKVTRMSGEEIMGQAPFHLRDIRPEYFIEIGDVLDIDVWRVPDVTRAVTVRPDGRISMPLVGDLYVVGLTLVQLKSAITQKLSEYIRNPQVSISMRQFGGRKFIALGELNSPGVYRYQNEISLIEAIALAGGFKKEAKRGKVMVIRGDIRKDPKVKIISANMENLLKRGILTENLSVLPNDIIYVGKDFFGDYNEVISDFISPTLRTGVDFFVLRSAVRTAQKRTA